MLKGKINRKIVFVVACFIILFTITSIIINAVRGNPTNPVNKVIIETSNYGDPGSYHIEKSAKWLDTGKAVISFNVDTIPQSDGRYKDVVFVIDMSGSMVGERLDTAKKNSKELVGLLLEDEHNSISLISFDTESEVLSGFTKDKGKILNEIDNLSYRGATNYNAALKNILEVLDGYEEKENTDLIVLFLTDGHPNEDTPNQIGTYQILKNMYPYIKVHGVQYEMGNTIANEIVAISDEQWIAYISSLHNVLIDAVLAPLRYEKYEIVDYIDKDYFYINSVNDIDVSVGNVSVEEENGFQKVIWNLGNNFSTGNNASMKININLKNDYLSEEGLFSTNDHEVITTKIENSEQKIDESDKTPVLKNYYNVIYDTNTPEGCTLDEIESESHFVFSSVTKKQDNLTCSGYIFKGFEIDDDDVVKVNDDVFIMPDRDVTIKAIWGKADISKSMDGKIYEKTTLYKAVENEALNGTEAILYENETNDGGGEENVYYYTGDTITKNNVVFGDYCWQIIRTTDTGGVKMIYNGKPDSSGRCGNDRGNNNNEALSSLITLSLNQEYNYSTTYTYNKQTKTFTLGGDIKKYTWNDEIYENLLGKYTCKNMTNSCDTLYYITKYKNESSAYARKIINNGVYNRIGISNFNGKRNSLSSVSYMYNTVYNAENDDFSVRSNVLLSTSLNTEFFYSDSFIVDGNNYKLVEPARIGSKSNYANMVGKYTFRDSSSDQYTNNYLYYIVAVKDSTMYYIQLYNGNLLDYYDYDILYSNEIQDNQDGTYSLKGEVKKFKKSQWYDDYDNLNHIYMCDNNNTTCSNMYYTSATTQTYYYYANVKNDYVYGNTFEYKSETDTHVLKNTVHFFDNRENYLKINNYHYTCFNTTGECENLYYVFSGGGLTLNYIMLNKNENISDTLDEMLFSNNVNQNNSTIKEYVDTWYEMNMIKYTDYLEDTVFCNDRTVYNLAGWNADGGSINDYLKFNNYNFSKDLLCPNKRDSFTLSSDIGNGKLIYPVGLLTSPESKLLNNNLTNYGAYWYMSPISFNNSVAYVGNSSGGLLSAYLQSLTQIEQDKTGIRPVISLKPNIEYTEGVGTTTNPFYVPTD